MSCENWRMKIYRRIADIMFVEINTLIFHYYFIRKKYHSFITYIGENVYTITSSDIETISLYYIEQFQYRYTIKLYRKSISSSFL